MPSKPLKASKSGKAPARPIRIVIADDHALLRAGLRMLIEAQRDMAVVGEAADGRDALAQAHALRPNVVLLDLTMPQGGIAALMRLRAEVPQTRVLVLTMHDDPAYAHNAMDAGASGYLVKSAADEELLSAIRAVNAGRSVVAFTSRARPRAGAGGRDAKAPPAELSAREQEVLLLLVRGHTAREIAEKISVGVKTAETYRSRIAEKLGLSSRADYVEYGLEQGLLVPRRTR